MSRFLKNTISFIYILFFQIILINSKTSLWKLNADKTKIIEVNPFHSVLSYNTQLSKHFVKDPLFEIITSTEQFGQSWIKHDLREYCHQCENDDGNIVQNSELEDMTLFLNEETLDCGKPVNFTYYDNLVGVMHRYKHPIVPEPNAIFYFSKVIGKKELEDFDIDALEKKLKKAKKEKPKSIQLYSQIGNFWRIKGHADKAIECFRRILASSPHNSEGLLHLARVLFALQYLDDAIYLTRRSLEVQPSEKSTWRQHLTLGEILKAYGHHREAATHLHHALQLNPNCELAKAALEELEAAPKFTIHTYTMVIIICLVLGVLLVILSSVDNIADGSDENRTHRQFNKMRLSMATKRCKR